VTGKGAKKVDPEGTKSNGKNKHISGKGATVRLAGLTKTGNKGGVRDQKHIRKSTRPRSKENKKVTKKPKFNTKEGKGRAGDRPQEIEKHCATSMTHEKRIGLFAA